ncbi:MAG: CarboxypepD reg-like domain [Planctomycetota bacterium]|jgi:protocatechuate 3,4-dioxygenase beta subunit
MKIHSILLAAALLSPCPACGDVSERAAVEAGLCIVQGSVVDARDGAPLAGARVDYVGAAREGVGATTDEEGRFSLEGLPAGATGQLRATLEGRESAIELQALRAGHLNVVLHL